ncbi:hypothetical protein BV25DRAFT_1357076 [Artomyces pyxidatus]|uniref:Uncharacterized protein n=1 Tax=Artomyces pyxidatus TaxID=48021 RepID=A0ACB8SMD3_9AGAM|nr:hypothetical protein BV25DRAFT_1357076 [Artomyces pyxidatus]
MTTCAPSASTLSTLFTACLLHHRLICLGEPSGWPPSFAFASYKIRSSDDLYELFDRRRVPRRSPAHFRPFLGKWAPPTNQTCTIESS